MTVSSSFLRSLVLVTGLLLAWESVDAQERVLSFESIIDIATDGSMTVTESIRVRAEGAAIRRGIFRDFPTRYRDRFGNRIVVAFDVLEVRRNGQPEPWFTERLSNGVRLYIGDEDVLLETGEYSYTIRYRTNRQLGYFQEHDELYWNVTGNGWGFAIDLAAARVRLPSAVPSGSLTMKGYTGPAGATGQDHVAAVFDGGATIRTTRTLAPGEGLTLVMTWPKGIVQQPSALQRFGYLLVDNLGMLLGILTLLATVIYLLIMWSKYGRDPEPGVIFPHYQPPAGYSPASARYISRMAYDTRVMTAAIVNLAVKGHVRISRPGDQYRLVKQESSQALAAGEKQLLRKLFAKGNEVVLENSNHKLISRARKAHAGALRRDYLDSYFRKNTALLWPCAVLLVVMLLAVAAFDRITPVVIVLAVFSALFCGAFAWLLQAPTPRGRLLLDKLEGFKLYLEVAEKDDLALQHPPELAPALFERYLPFAIALGVEQPWADRFTEVFARLAAEPSKAYQPAWYQGRFNAAQPAAFGRELGKGFTSAVAAASSAPGSSSGAGGGGFSGGGGGGGGGGGW